MTTALRRPPRLLMRTLAVTFGTVALLLAIVFVVVTLAVRNEVRQSVVSQLESSQRMFAALENRRLWWPRGKVLGGSSSINAMCYTRGAPGDYDEWAAST